MLAPDGLRQRLHQKRLRRARHALKERVPLGQERHQDLLDDLILPDDDLAQLRAYVLDGCGDVLKHLEAVTGEA